jgi:UDP-N-acetylenolpyruvoylglucosamine reductase
MNLPAGWRGSASGRFPLRRLTTLRVGGPAAWLLRPDDAAAAAEVAARAAGEGIELRALGAGSNLLVDDDGVDAAVVCLRRLDGVRVDGDLVVLGAGVSNAVALRTTRSRGLGGLDFLVGYPGTMGGAARMNAGGVHGYLADRVEWVEGADREGRLVRRGPAECGFRYRGSALSDLLLTGVALRLPRADAEETALRYRAVYRAKRASQPLDLPSAGCAWKNPPGAPPAGRLVDEAGCKGLRVGGAAVSTVHANFVVNLGGATCAEVLALMAEVRSRVLDRHGVALEPEVIHWTSAAVGASGR